MNSSTTELQAEHQAWLGQIREWEHELNALSAENGNLVMRADSVDAKRSVDRFENQISIHKVRLDQMKHNIKLYGGDIQRGQAELDECGEVINELKEEFRAFAHSLS
jgi:chromosome segregation ATPase